MDIMEYMRFKLTPCCLALGKMIEDSQPIQWVAMVGNAIDSWV